MHSMRLGKCSLSEDKELLSYMETTITNDKPFKTYDELVELLKERNVISS